MKIHRCQLCRHFIWPWQMAVSFFWHQGCVNIWAIGWTTGWRQAVNQVEENRRALEAAAKQQQSETVH